MNQSRLRARWRAALLSAGLLAVLASGAPARAQSEAPE